MAIKTLTHLHGSGCCPDSSPFTVKFADGRRAPLPGHQCKKRFPASVLAFTYLDEEGFLQIRTAEEDGEHVPMDTLGFARLRCHVCGVGTGGARRIKYLIKYKDKRGSLGSRRGGADSVWQAIAREDKMTVGGGGGVACECSCGACERRGAWRKVLRTFIVHQYRWYGDDYGLPPLVRARLKVGA